MLAGVACASSPDTPVHVALARMQSLANAPSLTDLYQKAAQTPQYMESAPQLPLKPHDHLPPAMLPEAPPHASPLHMQLGSRTFSCPPPGSFLPLTIPFGGNDNVTGCARQVRLGRSLPPPLGTVNPEPQLRATFLTC